MKILYYTLLLVSFLYSNQSFGNTEDCAEYSTQTQKEKQLVIDFCGLDSPESESFFSDLFPEFNELIISKEINKQEITDNDYTGPEIEWCKITNNKRINTLQQRRIKAINFCKSEFEKLYGHVGTKLTDLVPGSYHILQRKGGIPIQHDFNNDGIKDSIFTIVKKQESTTGRLLIALSQPNGQLKSIPVAAYHFGNNGEESGQPHTTFTLHKPNRFILTTQSLDNNNWDSREEWVFSYEKNNFTLLYYSSGYTSKDYDDATKKQ